MYTGALAWKEKKTSRTGPDEIAILILGQASKNIVKVTPPGMVPSLLFGLEALHKYLGQF
jgi:hypothetical protein